MNILIRHIMIGTLGVAINTINISYATNNLTPHVLLTSSLKWQQIPGMPVGGMVTVIDGNPNSHDSFVIRIKLPPNYHMLPHSHSINEYYTILSGTYYLSIGNEASLKNSLVLPAGSFVKIPALLSHSGWTKTETIIQIQGIGPHGLEYAKNQEQLNNTILP